MQSNTILFMYKNITFLISFFVIMFLTTTKLNAQEQVKLYRIAKIKVDSSQLKEYIIALQEQMNTAIELEPGVLSYTAVSDKKDPTSITILEIYANKESYHSHILTPHFKKYKETVKNMVLSLELVDMNLVVSSKKNNY